MTFNTDLTADINSACGKSLFETSWLEVNLNRNLKVPAEADVIVKLNHIIAPSDLSGDGMLAYDQIQALEDAIINSRSLRDLGMAVRNIRIIGR